MPAQERVERMVYTCLTHLQMYDLSLTRRREWRRNTRTNPQRYRSQISAPPGVTHGQHFCDTLALSVPLCASRSLTLDREIKQRIHAELCRAAAASEAASKG